MGHEINSATQEHDVNFGQSLRMFAQIFRVGLTVVFLSASRMLKIKFSSMKLLPTSVYSLMKS